MAVISFGPGTLCSRAQNAVDVAHFVRFDPHWFASPIRVANDPLLASKSRPYAHPTNPRVLSRPLIVAGRALVLHV